ncbi:hypothetical protein [Nitratifractor sp.]
MPPTVNVTGEIIRGVLMLAILIVAFLILKAPKKRPDSQSEKTDRQDATKGEEQ